MSRNKNVLATLFVLAAFIVPASTSSVAAQEAGSGEQRTGDLHIKILDLVFRVEDLGGRVQDLQVKESETEIRIELAADVLFDFDKADIRPAAQEALKQVATIIRDKAKGAVRIEGHTDSKGSDPYNQKLSERRAGAVKTWLATKEGLGDVQFITQGLGAKKPKVSNTKPDGSDDPDGRQKNRRVEIIVKK